jgi:O-antigen ligase
MVLPGLLGMYAIIGWPVVRVCSSRRHRRPLVVVDLIGAYICLTVVGATLSVSREHAASYSYT